MPAADLTLLTFAAQQASEIALKYWRSEQQVEHKESGSPVSEGDYAVDRFLRETLIAQRPGYGWLSEETPDDGTRLDKDTVFIVDPIDGTRAYVDGQPTWAISLAVVHAGQPTAGVVMLPARDKLYSAASGQGAHLNGVPIRTGTRSDPEGASILAPKASLDPKWWAAPVPAMIRHFRPSLAYRFCLVAEGRFDAMLTLRDAWEWDIAAGALVATEAGARVSDREGRPLRLNLPDARAPGILLAPPALHTAIRRRLP